MQVNSWEQYIGIIESIFEVTDINISLQAVLEEIRRTKKLQLTMEKLFSLFETRHVLVHEIPLYFFIPRKISEPIFHIEEVKELITLVHGMIFEIEGIIVAKLPDDFPDKIYSTVGLHGREEELLLKQVNELENTIPKSIETEDRKHLFVQICATWKQYYTKESQDNFSYIPHYRIGRDREFHKRRLCLERLRYLKSIVKEYYGV